MFTFRYILSGAAQTCNIAPAVAGYFPMGANPAQLLVSTHDFQFQLK